MSNELLREYRDGRPLLKYCPFCDNRAEVRVRKSLFKKPGAKTLSRIARAKGNAPNG